MQVELFKTMSHQFLIENWDVRKQEILKYIDLSKLIKPENQGFYSDRHTNNNSYADIFFKLFQKELQMFREEIGVASFEVKDVWTAEYRKGDWHPPHTHGSSGYSGVLYLDYDMDEHTPTYFIDPQPHPIHETTTIKFPMAMEGVMTIVPSSLVHFTYPNSSEKIRRIIGFDLKF